MNDSPQNPAARPGLTETLLALTGGEDAALQISLGEIVTRLDTQARGVLMILFALPNCLPGIPGTSAVTGLPLVFLTLQMALNRPPWLPGFIARRSLSRQRLAEVLTRAAPWIRRVERLIRPRLSPLTSDIAERVLGGLGMVLSLTIMLPIPLGNLLPAVALIMFSMGLIGRDGVWILAALITSVLSAALLVGAGWVAVLGVVQMWSGWLEM